MLRRPTVIVADDDEAVRLVVTRIVERLGCDVVPARDGQEALEFALGSESVDLLITDVDMPRLSGPELCEHLSRHRPGIRLILMTGSQTGGEGRLGSLPLLQKPFDARALTAAVMETLGTASPR
jgi:CheY-like chemotaxis protein